MTEAKVRNI